MRIFSTLLTFAAAMSGGVVAYTEQQYQQLFTQWIIQHNKVYPTDELFVRYHTYKSNLDYIHQHNQQQQQHSYTLAMNEFGDMTQQEFKAKMTGFKARKHQGDVQPIEMDGDIPESVDWRTKNAVTPIKNQGQCGSCYTFSSTGAIEGAVAIASGKLLSLSEQQLLDCSQKNGFNNQGCNGGWMDTCFKWVIANGGITSETLDPYISTTHTTCDKFQSVATITGYVDVPKMNETALQMVAAQQPISIAIEADSMQFQFYSSGVLDDVWCGTTLDHGVLIVGYGTDTTVDKPYWIVKNSWGPSWGEQGYVRLVRDKNQCGLAQQPSYPTGAKSLI